MELILYHILARFQSRARVTYEYFNIPFFEMIDKVNNFKFLVSGQFSLKVIPNKAIFAPVILSLTVPWVL